MSIVAMSWSGSGRDASTTCTSRRVRSTCRRNSSRSAPRARGETGVAFPPGTAARDDELRSGCREIGHRLAGRAIDHEGPRGNVQDAISTRSPAAVTAAPRPAGLGLDLLREAKIAECPELRIDT